MFGMSKIYTVAAILAASGVVLGAAYVKGRSDGRSALQAKLAADRIKIIQDGQEITNEILNSDDDALCAVIGGCGVPDENGGN